MVGKEDIRRARDDDRAARRKPRPLTISEAADFLGVSGTTLRRYEERGILRAMRTSGGHRRYAVEDLLRLKIRPPERVVLYVHVQEYDSPSESVLSNLRQAAEAANLEVVGVVTECLRDLALPLPERPGFQQVVRRAADHEIGGFLVDSLRMLGALSIAPWLEILAVLGLVCYEVPVGTNRAAPFPFTVLVTLEKLQEEMVQRALEREMETSRKGK